MKWYVVGAVVAGALLLSLVVVALFAPSSNTRSLVDLGSMSCAAPHEGRIILEAERDANGTVRYVVARAEPGFTWSNVSARAFASVPGRAAFANGEVLVAGAPVVTDAGVADGTLDEGDALAWPSAEAYRVELLSGGRVVGGTPRFDVRASFEPSAGPRAGNVTLDVANNASVPVRWAQHEIVVGVFEVVPPRGAREVWTLSSTSDGGAGAPVPSLEPGGSFRVQTISWPTRAGPGAGEALPGEYAFAIKQGDPGGELCGVRFLRLP